MPNAGNLTPESRFMSLFIGPKHSGKTVAACSFLESDKMIKVLDFDGRIRGLLGAPWIDRSKVDYEYYPPRTSINNSLVYEKINKDLEAMYILLSQNKSNYGTLIVDSVTAQAFALLCDAIPLTHKVKSDNPGQKDKDKGKKIGIMEMPGPEDFSFESNGTKMLFAFLRSLPIKNVIVTAHVIPKYGKPTLKDGTVDNYADSIVVGEKLSLRDKISADIQIYFDHIIRFDRKVDGNGNERFYACFKSELACTSFPNMPGGDVEITGKSFMELTRELANKGAQNAT